MHLFKNFRGSILNYTRRGDRIQCQLISDQMLNKTLTSSKFLFIPGHILQITSIHYIYLYFGMDYWQMTALKCRIDLVCLCYKNTVVPMRVWVSGQRHPLSSCCYPGTLQSLQPWWAADSKTTSVKTCLHGLFNALMQSTVWMHGLITTATQASTLSPSHLWHLQPKTES